MNPIKSIKELGCPEGFDSDLSGWHSDHDFFRQIIEEVRPKVIVEVGSWKGASACTMAKLTEELRTEIYCVDTWLAGYEHWVTEEDNILQRKFGMPQIYFQFLANLYPADFANRIYPIQQTSTNGARILKALGIEPDLIYIDGSHLLQDVYQDLEYYWPLAGKVMFGDDIAMPGVEYSVKRFCMERDLLCEIVDGIFWAIRK